MTVKRPQEHPKYTPRQLSVTPIQLFTLSAHLWPDYLIAMHRRFSKIIKRFSYRPNRLTEICTGEYSMCFKIRRDLRPSQPKHWRSRTRFNTQLRRGRNKQTNNSFPPWSIQPTKELGTLVNRLHCAQPGLKPDPCRSVSPNDQTDSDQSTGLDWIQAHSLELRPNNHRHTIQSFTGCLCV